MSLNDKDLKAIAKIVKESISGLEQDVSGLKEDVSGLKQDVVGIKGRLDEHDKRFDRIESDLTCIESDLTCIKSDLTCIKVDQLENNVIRRLNTIEACYLDASNRYIKNSDKFENAITDIDIMKRAIQKNSADILELKKLQQA
ncbi:hypothetical protein [Butyrivibrio sp. INlla16]|uniref:hypothetical protein n=1 Tax=Butyrivibrio sp. INlla16 TaxID=1520807 RepID=UPI00088F961B|nr:hypothetical protein [Butyrivibrio sp. INlla16]SDB60885.1 hypothetical protein SAMN02910263_03221 [Butyrivibrio sp. INlla16]